MNIVLEEVDKVTTELVDAPVRITRALCLGPLTNSSENDLLNKDLENIFKKATLCLSEKKPLEFHGNNYECCLLESIDPKNSELDLSKYYNLKEDERLFLIANLKSKNKREVLFRVYGIIGKIWVNNSLVYNNSGSFQMMLEKGNNTIIVELTKVIESRSIRICDLKSIKDPLEEYVNDFINNTISSKVHVIQDNCNKITSTSHQFMILPKDFLGIQNSTPLKIIVRNDDGSILDEFESIINHKIEYDFSKIKHRTSNMLKFEICYTDIHKICQRIVNYILINSLSNLIKKLEQQYLHLKTTYTMNHENQANIDGLLAEIKKVKDSETGVILSTRLKIVFESISMLYNTFDYVEQGLKYSDLVSRKRFSDGFFYSKIDNTLEKYSVFLPEDYSTNKSYPLVILIPPGRYDNLATYFEGEIAEDVIITTFSGRGVTTGSYIGEVSLLEGLHTIKKNFNIDEERVYLYGYSNGAYAAWALAQAHPYLFAGIVTLSGSPYQHNLGNLSNLFILNICGDQDYLINSAYHIPSSTLSTQTYTGVMERISNHWDVSQFLNNTKLIKWLLRHRKERYPRKIYYRTERNRHSKAYWVEIIEIEERQTYAEIIGEVLDYSTIIINTTNIKHCIILLPDYVRRFDLKIIINNEVYFLKQVDVDELHFIKKGSIFELQYQSSNDITPSTWGLGLLDIYMDSVKIVVPINYFSDEEKSIIYKVAQNFAHPKTAGWDPNIYVDYPVVTSDQINKESNPSNIIYISSTNCDDSFLIQVEKDLRIELKGRGYKINNNYVEGEYCLLFIQHSPWFKNKKALFIYTNNTALFEKNFFTRNVIIPSYSNGFHSYLNHEIIIYDQKIRAVNFHDIP
ncbi:hypothetical protein [Paenibacillus ginsengarvi]|uniref:Peptidase S9 prolyl oligopeptidase catalytic domain-containing protein n=1 Tax=Paenibacillus ginsengarvi TaxID=400777 RepID=A0A3B0BCJ5_9BACL|nr:hypothetical protein [Paenibacillus ginsengarvi]RKN70101.1 hypothetical protein D7M11_30585 [Paenibacillus ginsengarvi]